MTLTIQLSDENATALQAKAAAEGPSLEEWLQKLAEQGGVPKPATPAMPTDGASQQDHYIYGWPKTGLLWQRP
jgi:hypothetical protein